MKSVIYLAIISLTTIGVYAQDRNQDKIQESAKAIATKIGQELNFDDNKTLYLYKVLNSTGHTRQKAKQQLSSRPYELEETYRKIKDTFRKMLSLKFSEAEIADIKQLVARENSIYH